MSAISRRTQIRVAAVAAAVLATGLATATSASAQPTCFGQAPTITNYVFNGTFNVFTATNGPDVIIGTNGDDLIDGLEGDDIICGLGGNDDLRGGLGNDKIDAGDGTDLVAGDLVQEDAGAPGGPGVDIGTALVPINGGNDILEGGPGNDLVVGDHDNDNGSIYGNGGSDTITDSSSTLGPLPDPQDVVGDVLVGDSYAGEQNGNIYGNGGIDSIVDSGGDNDLLNGDNYITEGGDITGNGANDRLVDASGVNDNIYGDNRASTSGGIGGTVIGDGGHDYISKPAGFANRLVGDHFVGNQTNGTGGSDSIEGPKTGSPNLFAPPGPELGTRTVVGDHLSTNPSNSGNGGHDRIVLGDGDDGIGSTNTTTNVTTRAVVAGDNFTLTPDNGPTSGGGSDFIKTGAGVDRIDGGNGFDRCESGLGNDIELNSPSCEPFIQ